MAFTSAKRSCLLKINETLSKSHTISWIKLLLALFLTSCAIPRLQSLFLSKSRHMATNQCRRFLPFSHLENAALPFIPFRVTFNDRTSKKATILSRALRFAQGRGRVAPTIRHLQPTVFYGFPTSSDWTISSRTSREGIKLASGWALRVFLASAA